VVTFFSLTLLAIVQNILMEWKKMRFISGNYTSEHMIASWLYQLTIWTLIWVFSSFIVSTLAMLLEVPLYFTASMILLVFGWISQISTFTGVLGIISFVEYLAQVLFPMVINIIVIWVIDEYLMDPTHNYLHHCTEIKAS
jgi:flagellar biosynthesis protein FlhB